MWTAVGSDISAESAEVCLLGMEERVHRGWACKHILCPQCCCVQPQHRPSTSHVLCWTAPPIETQRLNWGPEDTPSIAETDQYRNCEWYGGRVQRAEIAVWLKAGRSYRCGFVNFISSVKVNWVCAFQNRCFTLVFDLRAALHTIVFYCLTDNHNHPGATLGALIKFISAGVIRQGRTFLF